MLLATILAVNPGCSSKFLSLEGRIATQQDNISLQQGGLHEGQWKSGDVIANYTCNNQADRFQIEETVEPTRRLTSTFRMVSQFSERANRMDEDRIILSSVPIVIAGNSPITPWQFNRNIAVPAGVVALNFSYTGTVRELGTKNGGIDSNFWKVP